MTVSRERVLVVEDQDVQRWVLEKQIEKLGYSVDAAADGEEALKILVRRPYDAVLMDCQMPGVDGYEATRRLRRSRRPGRRAVVIGITAHLDDEERDRCLRNGMDVVVYKPVGIQELAALLESWLATPRAATVPTRRCHSDTRSDEVLSGQFLDDSARQLDQMRQALRSGDSRSFRAAAHSLAGSSGVMRALPLAESCRSLEEMAKRGDLESCAANLPILEEAFCRTAGSAESRGASLRSERAR